jgi:hypothetical protein
MSPDDIGLATIAVTTGITALSTFLPALPDVHCTAKDGRLTSAVRLGELASAVVILGIGLAVRAMSGQGAALVLAAAAVVGLVALYEYALYDTAGVAR